MQYSHISPIRDRYQDHIRNVMRLIDHHSKEYTLTGEQFHYDSYTHLCDYVSRLKQYIKTQERDFERG